MRDAVDDPAYLEEVIRQWNEDREFGDPVDAQFGENVILEARRRLAQGGNRLAASTAPVPDDLTQDDLTLAVGRDRKGARGAGRLRMPLKRSHS